MKQVKKRIARLRKDVEKSKAVTTLESAVKITNTTVAEHREEVLGQARKFRYPLAQSRHRIVSISVWLAGIGLAVVLVYSLVLLYARQNYSRYAYQFTEVIPVPVARVDGNFVSYESYLFELRHVVHYKQTQESLDLNSEDGKSQIKALKQQSLDKAIDDQLVEKLAKQAGVFVSTKDIDAEVELLRSQQQLGAEQSVLENVLKRYYDWSYQDFRRSIHDQLLRQKYLSSVEKDKMTKAKGIVSQAKSGKDFAELAKQYSDDATTKDQGGNLPSLTRDRRDAPLNLIAAAFALKAGQISDPIETPYGIEIIKINENNGTEVKAQHIVIKYQNLSDLLKAKRDKVKVSKYIKV